MKAMQNVEIGVVWGG